MHQKILYHSLIGFLTLISDEYYIRKILFGKQGLEDCTPGQAIPPVLQQAEQELTEYLDGKRESFTLPIRFQDQASDFCKIVWAELQRIPYGETISYSSLARQIGRPNAVRAVGAACGKNPIGIVVPCHRVVGKNGALTGFAGGIDVKKALLALEVQKHGIAF